MVEIQLEYSLQSGATFLLRGRVHNVGSPGTPTLLYELGHGDTTLPSSGRLKPRQFAATPLPLCVAQTIQSAIARRPAGPNLRKTLERACIKLFVGGQERLDFVSWRMYDELEDEIGMLPALGRKALTPWRLGQRMLERAATVWPHDALLTMPAVLQGHKGVGYCRASDLPDPMRTLFEQQYCLAPQPQIEGVPDAYYASDVASFLSALGFHKNQASPLREARCGLSLSEAKGGWPDLTIATRKLHELGLADGDLGYAYWHDVAQLLLSSESGRKRIEDLERQLSPCVRAKKMPDLKGKVSHRS